MNTIIPDYQKNINMTETRIDAFFKENRITAMLKQSNFYKETGIPCATVLKELVKLVFTGKNLFRTLAAGSFPFRKNTAYRFLNDGRHNWAKVLLLLSGKLVTYLDRLTDKNRLSVLIIDDSLYNRNRSKKVELLANVYDHAQHKYMKGFRMLTLGWSDGNTFLPVAFNLVSSVKEDNVLVKEQEKDKRTLAHQRRQEARQKLPDAMLDLLKRAKDISARYVLFDSWYAHPKTICAVRSLGRHVICMLKNTTKIHYLHNGEWKPLKDIFTQNGFKSGGKAIIGSVEVKIRPEKGGETIDVKLVFLKDRSKKEWLALLSTDIDLADDEVIRIYGKRWDIEVFFKVCKSYLALSKEYQGRSYDLQVASTFLVFLRYTILAMESRQEKDDRTIGELFFLVCDELDDIKLAHSMRLLLDLLCQAIVDMQMTEKKTAKLLDLFLNSLPVNFQGCLLQSA